MNMKKQASTGARKSAPSELLAGFAVAVAAVFDAD